MDMSNFRPELHIAQQSRRDKLRVQQDLSPPHQHLGVYNANNLDQIYESSGLRNCRTGNLCYDSSEFCSEMMNPTSFNASSTVTTDQQYYTTWEANQGPIFVGEGSSRIVSTSHVSSSDGKAYVGFDQDLHSSSGYADMNSNSSLYHNALMQQLVSSSNARSFGLEFASLQEEKGSGGGGGGSWVGGGNELVLLPAYADQWGGGETELGFAAAKDGDRDVRVVRNDHSNTQALSLSLSCKAQENQISAKDFPTVDVNCGNNPNLSSGSRVLRQQPLTHRNPGPLGPFTGYATILRSSKFLRPAQVLLEELCCIARPKDVDISDGSNKIFEEVRVSRDGVVSNAGPAMKGVAGNSSGSSFLINGSSDKGRDSPSLSFHQPENLQKKAKLLYMQDEVCKRYKQYHQQMQMVVSSFESVAGLTAATPFVSLALKMISKHFRSLKNAITDQLKSLKNALGEESSPMSSKGDATNVSMLKLFDQNYDHKDKGSSLLESQHIWRPQRGLPERAVSILRAWLFDHFLHPYPTDTDKHMLATQTGLTRNQVSNWFINARVRVWKPMVEEIHMLETKGVSTEAVSDADGGKNIVADKQVGCSRAGSTEEGRANPGVWSQEKRSRNEYHVPDGVFVGGLGSVSLTLGLRQGEENGARPVMQQERLLRPHYGGQVVREFVG